MMGPKKALKICEGGMTAGRRRDRGLAILLGAVAICCLAWGGARAEDSRVLCAKDNLDPAVRIQACTAVILSGGKLQSDLAWAHNNRGADYVRTAAYDKAVQDLDVAIKLKPDNIAALNNRCYVLAVLGRAAPAIADCDRSLHLLPKNYRALDSRGYANLRAGRLKKAIADYDAALAINPKVAASLYGRGKAHLLLGHRAVGLADIQNAREIAADIDKEMAKMGIEP
jgi:tetratricopeptide (TPR) repeat protein